MARTVTVCLLVALSLWAGVSPNVAQEPAATEPAPAAETEQPPAIVTEEKSPLVKDPQTPEEFVDAVLLMLDIGRPKLARGFLDKFMETPPDEETLNRLRDKFGTSAFLRMAQTPELKPTSTKLLDLSNAAALRQLLDPARIAGLIEQLGGNSAEEANAILELRSAGAAAVPPLLKILNDPSRSGAHAAALRAAVEIGEPAVPPLVAALEAPTPLLRANAATALGYLKSKQAEAFLWQPALADPSASVQRAAKLALTRILNLPAGQLNKLASEPVLSRLLETSKRYARQEHQWTTSDEGKATLWTWDPQEQVVIPRQLDPAEASEIMGRRFARLALNLSPDRRDVQVQHLAMSLAADSRLTGLNQALPRGKGMAHDVALVAGPEIVDDVLTVALNSRQSGTALAALEILQQIGTKALLRRGTGLVAALNAPDRRVQFAAAVAILQIDPVESFTGSQRIVATLHRALENDVRPRAIVVQSSPDKASELGGFVSDLGFEPIVRTIGRDGFKEAINRIDVELVVLHANIIRWPLSETIANFRADSRTAGIPILVVGPERLRIKMETVLAHHSQIFYVAEAVDVAGFTSQVRPFLKSFETTPLSETELAEQRAAAVAWCAHLASGRRTKLFPLTGLETSLGKALIVDELADQAMAALGELPSAESQRLLHSVLVDLTAPVERRTSAARRLASHIQRFGLTLGDSEVQQVHALWQSAEEAEFHAAICTIIGSLKPDAALVGKRLRKSL